MPRAKSPTADTSVHTRNSAGKRFGDAHASGDRRRGAGGPDAGASVTPGRHRLGRAGAAQPRVYRGPGSRRRDRAMGRRPPGRAASTSALPAACITWISPISSASTSRSMASRRWSRTWLPRGSSAGLRSCSRWRTSASPISPAPRRASAFEAKAGKPWSLIAISSPVATAPTACAGRAFRTAC